MSNLRNRVQLIGHLGQNPEIKTFEKASGKMAKFSLATNENFKTKDGEWKTETTWHNIVAWEPLAERVEKILTKGSFVMIAGKLINREYTNQQNEKKYITKVQVSDFIILDKKSVSNENKVTEAVVEATSEYGDQPF